MRAGASNRAAVAAAGAPRVLPTLVPGPSVIRDDLAGHQRPRARARSAGAGCQGRFVPASGPACPPLDRACATIKPTRRGAAQPPLAGGGAATGPALEAVTTTDAHGVCAHGGAHASGHRL